MTEIDISNNDTLHVLNRQCPVIHRFVHVKHPVIYPCRESLKRGLFLRCLWICLTIIHTIILLATEVKDMGL